MATSPPPPRSPVAPVGSPKSAAVGSPATVPLRTSVNILGIHRIDSVAQTFVCELSITSVAKGFRGHLPKDFKPNFRIINCVDYIEDGEQWTAEEGDDVTFGWRVSGTFTQPFELQPFPFDSQVGLALS